MWQFSKKNFINQDIFKEAAKEAKAINAGRVAVLCMNPQLYEEYKYIATAGPFSKLISIVQSQEDHPVLHYASKRFVFSQPDFVLGLQFDTVFLIHVDNFDPGNAISWIEERDFLDRAYRGASWAKRRLILAACEETGGMHKTLQYLIQQGSLIPVKKR